MGYRGALLRRWSRRDRLAVLVVAVTVAFLTGTTLLLFAAGAQTASIAAQFDSPGSATYYENPAAARDAASGDDVVLPVARAERRSANGTNEVRLVGVPADAPTLRDRPLRVGNATTLGTLDAPRTDRLVGTEGSVTRTVEPRGYASVVFTPDWYVTDPATVERLGTTGAFVVHAGRSGTNRGVPLLGALAFFLTGTAEALRTLTAVAAGSALLVGVTVYSVSRMSVRDRLTAIQVVRATGGTPRTVLGVFALRAALLTTLGVALGYAFGVIVANGAVNVAVAAGLPTALSVGVTAQSLAVLVPLYVAVCLIGTLAGALAAWPVVQCAPGQVRRLGSHRGPGWHPPFLPSSLGPTLLGWRAVVPTAATLTAFVVFVVVVSGLVGAAGPVLNAQGTTVTEPGSTHPVNSRVPAVYADVLRERGIAASGEILLFEVSEGRSFPARGAEFGPFARVSDARLVRGRAHDTPDEAVIGEDLARTLDVDVGETVTLGGSTRSSLTRVRVVGVFDAPGALDDQLLVSLSIARYLAGRPPGTVHLIRAERLPSGTTNESGPEVVGLHAPEAVLANGSFRARVTVRNLGLARERTTVRVRFDGQVREATLALRPLQERTATVTFESGPPGRYRLTVDGPGEPTNPARNTTVTVRSGDDIELRGLPAEAPPGSAPLVRVTDATGAPVPGAVVSVDGTTRRTDGRGRVRVHLRTAGERTVRAVIGNRTAQATVHVGAGARREPGHELRIEPPSPSLVTRPTARIALSNPWNRTLVRTVRLVGPETDERWRVELAPGETRRRRVELSRRPPGTYTVETSLNGTAIERVEYRVTGDDRIVSALASSGRTGSSGIGRAVEVAFGNVQVLVGALVSLAALMTVGGTTATFAQAVHARRRTIGVHRATGATRLSVLGLVLQDVAVVGLVASLAAAVIAQAGLLALSELGYLTVFGVRVAPLLGPVTLAGTVLGGVGVTLVGAVLATVGLLLAAPGSLLTDRDETPAAAGGAVPTPEPGASHADGGETDA